MTKCECGLTWRVLHITVEVRYVGLIRCVCGRLLVSWEGLFLYTVERVPADAVPSTVADTVAPAPLVPPS
jgi:hypothetical protein